MNKGRRSNNIHAAYMAGLFDGEGTIVISMKDTHYCLYVAFSQHLKNKELLQYVQDKWGGAFYVRENKVGVISWGGKKAKPILTAIWPFSQGEKKAQIKLALQFISRMPGPGSNGQGVKRDRQPKKWMKIARQRMKDLKRRDQYAVYQ